eukprot:CAMPEP_0197456306 /NCGR_PEP_ID=MMETSP1175-20131217/42996_1 /TAXON_ID=1003142 /ORGANISM="Triceratium dubium, Strain CCMP147" /LENGTH=84 /DNA_ID=CAMNT_0042990351 /DNA_START=168 /DNA_END=422 /DNA_ORIENTATION=+
MAFQAPREKNHGKTHARKHVGNPDEYAAAHHGGDTAEVHPIPADHRITRPHHEPDMTPVGPGVGGAASLPEGHPKSNVPAAFRK